MYLKPGELHIARQPTIITTLLGSCVAIVIFEPTSKTTAVCHSVLPYDQMNMDREAYYYVDTSIEYMLDALRFQSSMKGKLNSRIIVKMFGGADVIKGNSPKTMKAATVGEQNVRAAEHVLAKYGLKADCRKVRGLRGYKLMVRSDSGEVGVKYLTKTYDVS